MADLHEMYIEAAQAAEEQEAAKAAAEREEADPEDDYLYFLFLQQEKAEREEAEREAAEAAAKAAAEREAAEREAADIAMHNRIKSAILEALQGTNFNV